MFCKCPNCGHEWATHPTNDDNDDYTYNGYLRQYVPQILQMMREGKNAFEIAAILNVSPHSAPMINYVGMRYGVSQVQLRKEKANERTAKIVARYATGEVTYVQLAQEFGVSKGRIGTILDRHKRKQREKDERRRIEYTPEQLKSLPLEEYPLSYLYLPARLQNVCNWEGYYTVGDLLKVGDSKLLKMPNFGKRSLAEWKQELIRLQAEYAKRENNGDSAGATRNRQDNLSA